MELNVARQSKRAAKSGSGRVLTFAEARANRAAAEAKGAKRYPGRPCKRGHDGIRYVAIGACVECMIESGVKGVIEKNAARSLRAETGKLERLRSLCASAREILTEAALVAWELEREEAAGETQSRHIEALIALIPLSDGR